MADVQSGGKIWSGVVTKLARRGKGAVIKNLHGPEEVLVPFTSRVLVEFDDDSRTIYTDKVLPWAEDAEKQFVVVGTEVMLASKSATFPTNRDDVIAISFRYHTELTFQNETHLAPKTGVIVIYHDFSEDVKAGFSGRSFAKSVLNWCTTKIFRPCYAIEAETNLTDLMGKLAEVKAGCGNVVVDTILIATHGSPGQLWLGNPDNMNRSNAIGLGNGFVSAQTFGSGLLDLFGAGLAIAIYSCNFLGEWDGRRDGAQVALALRNASQARAVYAAEGEVHFNAPTTDRPTVQCTTSYVIYENAKISVHASGAMPVFDL